MTDRELTQAELDMEHLTIWALDHAGVPHWIERHEASDEDEAQR